MTWTRVSTAYVIAIVAMTHAAQAEEYDRRCPEGSYITGFEGNAGAWLDRFTIYCASWNAKLEKLREPVKNEYAFVGHSAGGNPTSEHCPEGWAVAGKYRGRFAQRDGKLVVHSIEFNCRPATADEPLEYHVFGSSAPIAKRYGDNLIVPAECPKGEFAIGIFGNHDEFIDTVGFLCGAAPSAPAAVPGRTDLPIDRDTGVLSKPPGGFGRAVDPSAPSTPPPPPPPPPALRTATAIDDVDIYDGPGGQFDVVGMLDQGAKATVLDKRGGWYELQVNVPGGRGWVAADHLTINP